MEESKPFTIELSRTKKSGEFSCPKCGATISPNDSSNKAYTVLEPIMKKDQLEKIVIQCNRCKSQIQLTGLAFQEKSD